MHYDLLNRPRATVKISFGKESFIGKTRQGRVGLVSKRYSGTPLRDGEIWLVDVVKDYENYFIMIPIEKIKDATETTENSTISD